MKIKKFNESNSDPIISDIFDVIDRLTDYTDNGELDIKLGVFKYNKEGVGYTDDDIFLNHRFLKDPNFYKQMFDRKINSGYNPCIILLFKIKKDLQEIGSQFDDDWSNLSSYINIFNILKIFEQDWNITISHGGRHHQYQPLHALLIYKQDMKL